MCAFQPFIHLMCSFPSPCLTWCVFQSFARPVCFLHIPCYPLVCHPLVCESFPSSFHFLCQPFIHPLHPIVSFTHPLVVFSIVNVNFLRWSYIFHISIIHCISIVLHHLAFPCASYSLFSHFFIVFQHLFIIHPLFVLFPLSSFSFLLFVWHTQATYSAEGNEMMKG